MGSTVPLRRHLLAGLRDAHAAGTARLPTLRRGAEAAATPPARRLFARLAAEAEEQLHRLDLAFALLREVPGGGARGDGTMAAVAEMHRLARSGAREEASRDAALAICVGRELARAATETDALRLLADAAGLHRVARLLDGTAAELHEAAGRCERLATGRKAGPAGAR